jgi:hypothetical protein
MKKLILTFAIATVASLNLFAQRSKVTVLNIDTKGINLDPTQMGGVVRMELDKLDTFEVMDRYDVNYVIEKNKLNTANCYGKICLVETGKLINTDKILTGSVELVVKSYVVTLKLIDIKTESVERTTIIEFLELPDEIQSMIGITLGRMFNRKEDPILVERLTKKNNYESAVNNPNKNILKLSGPRMGFIAFTGQQASVLGKSESIGGYNAFPVMFQFGYQFEKQYLNEGNFQALFEFVPMITGLDQGKFFPSITVMNGLRSNLSGWEFAFGPTFSLDSKAKGYYQDGVWHLESDWNSLFNPNPYEIVKRSDSRGDVELTSNFVVAVGKTVKSGKMNIPINAFVIPTKTGVRFGISFGYNAKK